ncbi:IclR family transcriptional regulator [Saccharothrix sp. ST-888]|uniref:IclR family transcriptional regulator n=1 Tax=Saccharothrix sp. ST-888 TaxID=1427391 RepID=UPI0005EC4BD6|nr:IclR family transcriptional regulator [Saccharothrix sp. ST-888]KJK60009.1 IclR family transcriptional regulator [Saccharothrix sp. ST-888]
MAEAATIQTAPAGAQAVQRALGLLHCFHDNGPDHSASDLARRTGLSVSTAHRLARTLVSTGFLEQDARTARYRLGPAVAELGQLTFHQRGLHLAGPELDLLTRRTGAIVDLAIRSGPHAVILVGGSVRRGTGLGLRRPLHSTALGKVLLAWPGPRNHADIDSHAHAHASSHSHSHADEVAGLGLLTAFTPRTITEPALLVAELAKVRAAGYALNDGESAVGVRTVAVPVLDHSAQARFALTARSTPDRLTDRQLSRTLDQARACAAALGVLLLPPEQRA